MRRALPLLAWVTVTTVSGAVLLLGPPLPIRLACVLGLAAGAALAGMWLGEAAGEARTRLKIYEDFERDVGTSRLPDSFTRRILP